MSAARSMLEPYLEDPEITAILIDGHEKVSFEKDGELHDISSPFQNAGEVYDLARAILEPLGKQVNETNPLQEARLVDGTLVNVVIPPIAQNGPVIALLKAVRRMPVDVEKLVKWGSISQAMVDFLRICVLARVNIAVAGGTAAGKTTMLHVLSRWIPDEERILVLQTETFFLPKKRVVNLETRPADREGKGEVSMRDLLHSAAHLRPDRILVVEIFGAEVVDMFQMMNNGYDGSMFSVHASSLQDALARLEVMSGLGAPAAPVLALREQMASAINLITYQERLLDGSRKMTRIAEVIGVENGVVITRDLFEFRRTGVLEGKIQGYFTATGALPTFLGSLQEWGAQAGVDIPVTLFTPTRV